MNVAENESCGAVPSRLIQRGSCDVRSNISKLSPKRQAGGKMLNIRCYFFVVLIHINDHINVQCCSNSSSHMELTISN